MSIDVVISTKDNYSNKNFSIQYVIRALLHQSNFDLNIVIADNGSKDETEGQIRELFSQKVSIIDTSTCSGNISASRNAAAECGSGKLIFFMDDDMIANSSRSFSKCLEVAEEVDFACGARRLWAPLAWPTLIRPDDPINKLISTLEHTSNEPVSINRLSGKNILDNRSYLANFGIIKRNVFEKIGGFDENYISWGYQDTDLMWQLCIKGYSYDLFSKYDVDIFHLSHKVNKSSNYEQNRMRFMSKQKEDGRLFNINHFFEVYENDGYSLFSDFPDDNSFLSS